jgi:divalent metal cation (Fe/Co/Zn/Cd) transporter
VLDRNGLAAPGVQFHALRTRQAGARRFLSFHVLVPGAWTVHAGHALLETIEHEILQVVPNSTVFTHLESLDDERSWGDMGLDRQATSTMGPQGLP